MNLPRPAMTSPRSTPAEGGHRPSPEAAAPAASRRAVLAGLLGAAALGGGCMSIDVGRYAAERPELDLRRYFDGRVDAWGVFQDRFGRVVRRFTVAMHGSWRGDVGTLDEDFFYSDGTKEKRIWTIRRLPDGHYVGTAADVVGEAQGRASGNALNWRYVLALPVDGRVWHVDLDDWMYQIDERVMLNRAVMSKLGVRLGEVLLSFSRR